MFYILKCFSRGRKLERDGGEGKESCPNISQFAQNLVKCWVPVSFRDYISALVPKHRLFRCLQKSLLVGTSYPTFDQVARGRSKLSGSLHFLWEPMRIRLLQYRIHKFWAGVFCMAWYTNLNPFPFITWLFVRQPHSACGNKCYMISRKIPLRLDVRKTST